MTGQLDNGVDGRGVRYAARVRVLNQGGEVSRQGNVLRVNRADAAVLIIAAATDYRGFAGRQLTDPEAATLADLNQAAGKSFRSLRQAHVADYHSFFQRVSLQLVPVDAAAARRPTPGRLRAFQAGTNDLALPVLCFDICSTPAPPFKLTVISVPRPPWPKCSCKVRMA